MIASTLSWSQNSMNSSRSPEMCTLAGDIDGHLHGEHRRAGMRCGVAARRDFGDLDFARREEAAQAVHDAGLIEADDVDGIGQELLAEPAAARCA